MQQTTRKSASAFLKSRRPQFPKGKGRARDRALQLCAEMIEAHVKSRSGIFEDGIFPSVPLAFGYF